MPNAIYQSTKQYVPPGTTTAVAINSSTQCPHTVEAVGNQDIPDGTALGTSIPVPFGTINVAASCLVIKNTNNQDMLLTLNGNADLYALPPGGQVEFVNAVDPSGDPILSASLKLTALQSGDGTFNYYVFGV